MKQLRDKFALCVFDVLAASKGYRFSRVTTAKQNEDITNLYAEQGFVFPDELRDKVKSYRQGTINFVAYHKNTVAGMVRLADPHVNNRPYELYGVDADAEHYEIQSLLVSKDYREGTQFVMLGLFKEMYKYSVQNDISSWSSCGVRAVYLTMKRFCKKIEIEHVNFATLMHPLTQYLYRNNIIDTYFTMEVSSFEPWNILKRCIKQMTKKWHMPEVFHFKKHNYAGLNYGSK